MNTPKLKPCPICKSKLQEGVNRHTGYGRVEYQGYTSCTNDNCSWFIVWPSNIKEYKEHGGD